MATIHPGIATRHHRGGLPATGVYGRRGNAVCQAVRADESAVLHTCVVAVQVSVMKEAR